MDNRIIVTACNSRYFHSVQTLIASIHRLSIDTIDHIYVFNLGLTTNEIKSINSWKKCSVENFPEYVNTNPKDYAFKCFINYWAQSHGKHSLWLDAGVMLLKSIDIIFNTIEQDDIFLVGDIHKNSNYTSRSCINIMQATKTELNGRQLSAGILGYKSKGKYQNLIDEAYEFSKDRKCIAGSDNNHRQDQSIYSILSIRYGCPRQDLDTYGYWTDANRNLKTANEYGSVIFVHRNGHWDFNGLLRK